MYDPADLYHGAGSDDDHRTPVPGRRAPAYREEETMHLPAGPGWRVRFRDDDGRIVVLAIAAWSDEDPLVVTEDRLSIDEVPADDYVILQPYEPDDFVVPGLDGD